LRATLNKQWGRQFDMHALDPYFGLITVKSLLKIFFFNFGRLQYNKGVREFKIIHKILTFDVEDHMVFFLSYAPFKHLKE
jgi:hypothetical protein